jgi:hypothetical protein
VSARVCPCVISGKLLGHDLAPWSTEVVSFRAPFVALLAVGASLSATSSATARPPLIDSSDPCGCNPVLVGWGHSQGGQEWGQRYGIYKRSRFLMISLPDGKGSDNGGGSAWDGDALSRFVFDVDFGDGFGGPDPKMLDGAARQDVKTITFDFTDRPPVTVHPYMASKKLRHRFPFLRHIRFYIAFFSGGDGTLQTATAYDGAGRKLKTQRFGSS